MLELINEEGQLKLQLLSLEKIELKKDVSQKPPTYRACREVEIGRIINKRR